MNLMGRTHPDYLVDSCKRSSINRVAVGLKLSKHNHMDVLSFLQTCFHLTSVRPSILQTFC